MFPKQVNETAEKNRYGGYDLESTEASGLLISMVPQGARVLDVGCGDGTLAMMLRDQRSATVVGLEPNAERATVAASRGITVYQLELNPSLVKQLGRFDVVLFADVIEHIPDPTDVLRAAIHFLQPGGMVLASVPNVAHWTVRLNLLRGRFEYTVAGMMDSTHLRWYTRSTLLQLFNTAGYSVDEARASTGLWIWEYKGRRPWRWLSEPRKHRIVRWLTAKRPTIFGYQHIVKAIPN